LGIGTPFAPQLSKEQDFGAFGVLRDKKKIIALLAAAVLGSVAVIICPGQSGIAEPGSQGSVGSEPHNPAQSRTYGYAGSTPVKDPNLFGGPAAGTTGRELFLKMMFSVLLVAVLGIAAVYITKKFGSRLGSLSGRNIRVIETVHLGPRKALHLLKVGSSSLLVGSSSDNITMLADVTGTLEESACQTAVNNRGQDER